MSPVVISAPENNLKLSLAIRGGTPHMGDANVFLIDHCLP